MKVQVTQEYINVGVRHECYHCPIALALSSKLGWSFHGVGARSFAFMDGFKIRYIDLPQAAVAFIKDFDHGMPVQPFEFEVEIP